ncbi:alpha/beta hydrolase [Ulvibacterium sp.]|uniref:alpha/beta fold hydrolase n=1 Tax=Ulvibacterium sp. TaxID=2665914 RepID=UPI002631AFE1|nr:alpha/beta hydrolase [Ulvibacterium sp.]
MKVFSFLILFFFAYPVFGQGNYLGLKDGTNLYVEEAGNGETLLFIPGWTMTHRFFEKQKEYFSERYHVVLYDPRGQGRSDKTTYKNTYAHHAADLRELILQKELNEIVLVGWSSGCLAMYEYLRAFGGNRIRKMVFIDEPPKWIGSREKEWVYGTFDDYRSSLKGMISEPSEPDDIIDWMLRDSIDDTTRTWMRKEIRMTPPNIALSLYIDGLVSDYTKEVGQLEIPSVFMVRASWYDQASAWLKTYAPKAKIKPITSHAMFWERAEEFNALLEDFIDSN